MPPRSCISAGVMNFRTSLARSSPMFIRRMAAFSEPVSFNSLTILSLLYPAFKYHRDLLRVLAHYALQALDSVVVLLSGFKRQLGAAAQRRHAPLYLFERLFLARKPLHHRAHDEQYYEKRYKRYCRVFQQHRHELRRHQRRFFKGNIGFRDSLFKRRADYRYDISPGLAVAYRSLDHVRELREVLFCPGYIIFSPASICPARCGLISAVDQDRHCKPLYRASRFDDMARDLAYLVVYDVVLPVAARRGSACRLASLRRLRHIGEHPRYSKSCYPSNRSLLALLLAPYDLPVRVVALFSRFNLPGVDIGGNPGNDIVHADGLLQHRLDPVLVVLLKRPLILELG